MSVNGLPKINVFLRIAATTIRQQRAGEISIEQLVGEIRGASSRLLQHCINDEWPGVMAVIVKKVVKSFDDWRKSYKQLTN